MEGHAISDAAAICLAIGGALAVAGVFALRRLLQRPLLLVPAVAEPGLLLLPPPLGFSASA